MAEYIEREAVLKEAESRIMWGASAAAVYELIRDAPAADVATVRHGRWTPLRINGHEIGVTCSGCNTTWDAESNRCPHCGAKMDGEANEKD